MERKLASIRTIKAISSIDGADNIEKVIIDGWQCITKKGEFQPGDLCIYFEIDSFLPIKPEFEFLRKSSYRKQADKEGFRLRTVRLRGTLSQGLALPISILPKGFCIVDDDATETLGVTKWDPPIPAQLSGKVKGNFPIFIHKTDQERIQNIWDSEWEKRVLAESFEVTVKLDGSSCTYYLYGDYFGVCSRNLELIEDENNTFWKIARRNKVEELLRTYGRNIALQGEVIGESIQSNAAKIKEQEFYLFDIWDIGKQAYMMPFGRKSCYDRFFSTLEHVPILDENFWPDGGLERLLNLADGPLSLRPIEGIVLKSNISNLTFKIISNEYLLKEKG